MTKDNISKAQLEVWNWKESLYMEIKDIPDNKKIEYIHTKTAETVERLEKAMKKSKLESNSK